MCSCVSTGCEPGAAHRGTVNVLRASKSVRNSFQYCCCFSLRIRSQATLVFHSCCTKVLERKITGPTKPCGSNNRAVSDTTRRLVIGARTSQTGTLNRNTSSAGCHSSPKVLIGADDESSSNSLRFSRSSAGMFWRIVELLEAHLHNLKPADPRSSIS
uniref:(northern house mosquito) hypothetical protein n=1 Tax=Culex pipiens TaxID=7175 RepID=A0A8D8FKV7_CULPI